MRAESDEMQDSRDGERAARGDGGDHEQLERRRHGGDGTRALDERQSRRA
ncbi:MAG: hypothetical protein RI967_1546 [Planctomycetota bacterium]